MCLQALTLGALSANISSEEPIDMVMHESAPDHEHLWDKYKQVRHLPALRFSRRVIDRLYIACHVSPAMYMQTIEPDGACGCLHLSIQPARWQGPCDQSACMAGCCCGV